MLSFAVFWEKAESSSVTAVSEEGNTVLLCIWLMPGAGFAVIRLEDEVLFY